MKKRTINLIVFQQSCGYYFHKLDEYDDQDIFSLKYDRFSITTDKQQQQQNINNFNNNDIN